MYNHDADTNETGGDDPLIGKVVSERYRVLERIGQGGFGAVYKVQHIRLDKTLALKVLFEHATQNPRMIKRFEREARATCRIGHDNIVEINDYARDRRIGYYFVMEHLVGETLAERLNKLGPMPGSRIIHVGCQIADALAATHAKGIVHRDLKPDNIFLMRKRGEEDFVKILDFGIAAMGDFDESAPRLTRHGAMLGTPAYMSPEQAEGRPPDNRSDIYSLGIILYEMATGKVPYQNAASMAVLEMHRSTEPVPPRRARPDLTIAPSLEQVILRALRKPVEQRYQSMREVYNDLVNVSHQIDMSGVVRSVTGIRVDSPLTPRPDDVEPEEPEWLDEDLVLLEDDDEPGPTRQLDVLPPTAAARVEAVITAPEEIEVTDDDIVEAVVVSPGQKTAPRWSEPAAPAGSVWAAQSATTPRTSGARVVRRDDPETVDRSKTVKTSLPLPGPTHTAPPREREKRRVIVIPWWQRPLFLMAAGFVITLALYGLYAAFVTPPGAAPGSGVAGPSLARTDAAPQPQARVAATRPVVAPAPAAGPRVVGKTTRAAAPAARPAAAPVAEASADEAPTVAAPTAPEPAIEIAARDLETEPERKPRTPLEVETSEVEVVLWSEPSGAAVYRGDEKLGETPFELWVPKTETEIKLRFELEGQKPQTKRIKVGGDAPVVTRLREKSEAPRTKRPTRRKSRGSANTYEMF